MRDWLQENFGDGSSFYAGLTLLRYPLGISLLLLPWSLKFSGIIAGPIVIAIFVIVNAYRSQVLSKIVSELTESGIASPSGCSDWWILENSLGKISRRWVNCSLVIFSMLQWCALLGHASTFLAFAGLGFNQEFPNEAWPGVKGQRVWIGICVCIVIFAHAVTQWLRNIMHNSGCMVVSVCSTFVLILLPALFVIFLGLPAVVTFAAKLAANREPLHPSIDVKWENFGLVLAGVVFVTGATPDDVTATYGALKNRLNFPVVLLSTAAILMFIGIGFAIAAFLGLDDTICDSVTFNLPLSGGLHRAIRVILSVCALIFISFRHQIEPQLSNRLSTAEIVCDIVFKMIFLGVAGALAIGFPTFAGLACVFGSLTSFSLTLTFPFLSDLLLHVTGGRTPGSEEEEKDLLDDGGTSRAGASHVPDPSISAMRVVRDVIFMILGLMGAAYGLYGTITHWQSNTSMYQTATCAQRPTVVVG